MIEQHVGEAPSASPESHNGVHHHGVHGGNLATLALCALGVVFGDIGTSPLYTLKECLITAAKLLTPTFTPISTASCRLCSGR